MVAWLVARLEEIGEGLVPVDPRRRILIGTPAHPSDDRYRVVPQKQLIGTFCLRNPLLVVDSHVKEALRPVRILDPELEARHRAPPIVCRTKIRRPNDFCKYG